MINSKVYLELSNKGFFQKNPLYLKNPMYRYLLLKNIKVSEQSAFMYSVFRLFDLSNFILNKNLFFWWLDNVRLKASLNQTEFYKNVAFNHNNSNTYNTMYTNFLVGFRSMWLSLRFWIFPAYLGIFSFMFMSYTRLVTFNILVIKCLMLAGVVYWLLSGFTFFLKKYQYRYFTSSLQRFWKRCYAIFWMLEFFTFFCFLYLTLMASQEPFLMYDNAQIFKTHLFSWRYFLPKMVTATILIIITYFAIISVKWTTTSKIDIFFMGITLLLLYIAWVEFYQFFHVISYYGNMVWKLSEDNTYWFLETEFKRTRINNHFVTICLIAKFWHIVFTVIFWLFFVVRGLEMSRVRYPLLVANFQNFIFVYILAWLYMYPWVKYATLKLFNTPYYWFYVNNKRNILYILSSDFYFIVQNFFSDIVYFIPNSFNYMLEKTTLDADFYYMRGSSVDTSFTQFRKQYIRDIFIKFIN